MGSGVRFSLSDFLEHRGKVLLDREQISGNTEEDTYDDGAVFEKSVDAGDSRLGLYFF